MILARYGLRASRVHRQDDNLRSHIHSRIQIDDIFIQHDTPPDRHRLKKDRNISILRKHVANGARAS